ncbi:MAG: phage portal protein [Sedimentisphaerales bacterium]|nr:phage portal protein [Sedimentisphaerales bacterium]
MAGLFKRIANAFSAAPKTPGKRSIIKRYYEAAHPDRDLTNHFKYAAGGSAASLVSADFRTLRKLCEYEVRNNSYAAGIVQTLANDVVGNGPKWLFDDGMESLEADFANWAENCDWLGYQDLGGLLRQAVIGLCQADGAFFGKQYEGPELKLMAIDPVRVDSPSTNIKTGLIDGIEFLKNGRRLGYYVNNSHPASLISEGLENYKFYTQDRIYHLFRIDRPGQHRGIPWLAPAIGLFALLRDFTRSTVKAAKRAAALSVIMNTNDPQLVGDAIADDDYEPPATFDEIEIPEDSMLSLPEGYGVTQFKAEHPATTYEMFKAEILAEIGRCLNMPLNITSGNCSKYNFASGRLDHRIAKLQSIEFAWMRGKVVDGG